MYWPKDPNFNGHIIIILKLKKNTSLSLFKELNSALSLQGIDIKKKSKNVTCAIKQGQKLSIITYVEVVIRSVGL